MTVSLYCLSVQIHSFIPALWSWENSVKPFSFWVSLMLNFLRRGSGRTLKEEGFLLVVALQTWSVMWSEVICLHFPPSHTYNARPLKQACRPGWPADHLLWPLSSGWSLPILYKVLFSAFSDHSNYTVGYNHSSPVSELQDMAGRFLFQICPFLGSLLQP